MSTRVIEVNDVKNGSYIVIDGEPCRVVDVQHAKTGKHGHAKARIVAIGLFDGVKRAIALPTSDKVETPLIEKINAQILSKQGENTYLVMDMNTYEQFEARGPDDEEIRNKLESAISGGEVLEGEVWRVMGRAMIIKLSRA